MKKQKTEIIKEIINILNDFTDEEIEITQDSHLIEDIGLSSLDMINLKISIEDKYNIKLPYRQLSKISTISDLIKYVEKSIK